MPRLLVMDAACLGNHRQFPCGLLGLPRSRTGQRAKRVRRLPFFDALCIERPDGSDRFRRVGTNCDPPGRYRSPRATSGRSTQLVQVRPPASSHFVTGQQFPDTVFQRLEMSVDYSGNSKWVDIAQIVVHENIPEATNFAPGDSGATGLQRLRQVLGSLRLGL